MRAGWPEVVLPGACGSDGQMQLVGDAQYVGRVGDIYTLRDEHTGLDVAAVELGKIEVRLPVVFGL